MWGTPLKNRGIIVSILYIPYQPINPVNTSFSGNDDDAANNNIPNIPASDALNAMLVHAINTAHIKS